MQKNGSPLKLGFVGGSLSSAVGHAHAVACVMDRRFELAAGCFSEVAETNHETGRAYGVADDRVHASWSEMIDRERARLDAVAVLVPTPMHREVAGAFLAAGIPVICEKALACTSRDALELHTLAAEKKGFLAVTYNYSGYPMVRELRHLIRQGRLGDVLHFQVEMPQEGFIKTGERGAVPTPQTWRLRDGEIPTLYLDLGVHLHQLIFYLIGQHPLEVIADQASCGHFAEIIDHAAGICRYSNNVRGQIWFSKASLGYRNGLRLRIFGSKGSAEWLQMNPEELHLAYENGKREVLDRASGAVIASNSRYNRFKAGHPAGFLEAFANLYVDIADCLGQYKQQGTWSSEEVFGTELSLEGLRFLEAMVRSAHTGTWQKVA